MKRETSLTPSSDGTDAGTHPGPQDGVRVLVVDDNPLVRRSVRRALASIGFVVSTAEDVGPAMQIVESNIPDIVLVDLGMPTDGLELVRHLKLAHGPAIHVAVLSGNLEESARVDAFDAGADDFLIKPVPLGELQRRMVATARNQSAFVLARQTSEYADRLRAYSAEAAALLAHDLNNGLGIALSNISYLSEILDLQDDAREAMASTQHALTRMAGLVANFVDIGRFEDVGVRVNATTVEVRELLLDVLRVHAPVSRMMQGVARCEPELRGYFDAALIERVLHNLVGNSMRYCNEGGTVTVGAGRWEYGDHTVGVEITVHNSGPPIPEDLAANLFTKYARGANGKRGMGLYFCRLACEAHGGSIDVENAPDGPVFTIRLPGPVLR